MRHFERGFMTFIFIVLLFTPEYDYAFMRLCSHGTALFLITLCTLTTPTQYSAPKSHFRIRHTKLAALIRKKKKHVFKLIRA